MPFLQKIILLLLLILFLALIYGLFRQYQTQHDSRRSAFQTGHLPSPLPDGPYKGTVANYTTSWQGKNFYVDRQAGDNLFKEGNAVVNRYPFKTYSANSLSEKKFPVYKIDYNISGNPLWLRLVLDEIVETSPNNYLGKVHLRILPGLSLAIAWFNLAK